MYAFTPVPSVEYVNELSRPERESMRSNPQGITLFGAANPKGPVVCVPIARAIISGSGALLDA